MNLFRQLLISHDVIPMIYFKEWIFKCMNDDFIRKIENYCWSSFQYLLFTLSLLFYHGLVEVSTWWICIYIFSVILKTVSHFYWSSNNFMNPLLSMALLSNSEAIIRPIQYLQLLFYSISSRLQSLPYQKYYICYFQKV